MFLSSITGMHSDGQFKRSMILKVLNKKAKKYTRRTIVKYQQINKGKTNDKLINKNGTHGTLIRVSIYTVL